MSKIDKDALVAEIKRRITDNTFGIFGAKLELMDILAWLDTFPDEPENVSVSTMAPSCWSKDEYQAEPASEDLEEEVKNYFGGYWPGTDTPEQCNTDLHFTPPAILRLARHFAEWGAEHLRKPTKMMDDDLEKVVDARMEEDGDVDHFVRKELDEVALKYARLGAEWQKERDNDLLLMAHLDGIHAGDRIAREQMMKEAVDADVLLTLHDKTGDISLHTGYLPKELGIKYGDKVKLIVIKED